MLCGIPSRSTGFFSPLSYDMSPLYGLPSWPPKCDSVREKVCRFRKKREVFSINIIKSHFTRNARQASQHSPSHPVSTCGYVRQGQESAHFSASLLFPFDRSSSGAETKFYPLLKK